MNSSQKMSKDTASQPINDIHDSGSFTFYNGDKYEGEFIAQRQPLMIMKEGKGTYFTNDGSTYAGSWFKDILNEADEITFPDQSKFSGFLDNMVMEGVGSYVFREGVEIHGYLTGNRFGGEVELIDPTGHTWKGTTEVNDDEITFHPVQSFWESICKMQNLIVPFQETGEENIAE